MSNSIYLNNRNFASLVRNIATATDSLAKAANLLADLSESQAETPVLHVPSSKPASKPVTKSVPVQTKKVIPASRPSKPVPASKPQVNVSGGEFTATADGDSRVRVPVTAFSNKGQCIVNGKLFNAQSDGRGRFTTASFDIPTDKGDVIIFKPRKGRPFEYVAMLVEDTVSRPSKPMTKSVPVSKKVVPSSPSKPTSNKPQPKRVMPNAGAKLSSNTARRSNLEVKTPRKPANQAKNGISFDSIEAVYAHFASLAQSRYDMASFVGNTTYNENDIRFYLTADQRKVFGTAIVKVLGGWQSRENFLTQAQNAFGFWIEND